MTRSTTHSCDAYHKSKTMAERAARDFAAESGLEVSTVNPSMIMGPLLQGRLGWSSPAVVFRIGLFVERALINVVASAICGVHSAGVGLRPLAIATLSPFTYGVCWRCTLCVHCSPGVFIIGHGQDVP
jgi:hypothetical protein